MDWLKILTECGVKPVTAEKWAPIFAECIDENTFSAGATELDDFLGQVLHESGMLEHMEEGLRYSTAERLMAVWPKRFPTLEAAQPYVNNPPALANKVYGGRLGNTEPGDGWKYRGSGLIQVTGLANFAELERVTGLPLVDNPDMLRRPGPENLRVCIAWWEGHVPDSVMGDTVKVRKAVNGGTVGLADAARLTRLAEGAIEGQA